MIRFTSSLVLAAAVLFAGSVANAEPLAKRAFGGMKLPAATKPTVHGFYSKGCLAGGIAIATDGPRWQAMRLSRNRRWGHPQMIKLIERLSNDAAQYGWPGLLVGDISQPRGGPMLTGHASHQVGLDADIWLTPMPKRRLTARERERKSAVSVLQRGGKGVYVNDKVWTPAHLGLIKTAASYKPVERILVHPGIKKKLCETATGDRTWLQKVRPFWGHHYHFHIRIGCPKGSPGCRSQKPVTGAIGCDKELDDWFALLTRPAPKPSKPKKKVKPKPKARDIMKISDLPAACRSVLAAPAPASEEAVTLTAGRMPSPSASALAAPPKNAWGFELFQADRVPRPQPRPYN